MTLHTKAFPGPVAIVLVALALMNLATSVSADYQVKVTNDQVQVSLTGDLLQGVPDPPRINSSNARPFGSIPNLKIHLEGKNSTTLSSYLVNALREKSPSASPTNLILDSTSDGRSYHYTLVFNVEGVTNNKLDVQTVDLAWRSFVIADDVRVGNFSVNTLVTNYLKNQIIEFAKLPESSGGQGVQEVRRWYLNNRPTDTTNIGSSTDNMTIFNFSSLKTPLQSWTKTPNITSQRLIYQMNAGFNLTMHEQIIENTDVANLFWNVVYKLNSVVEAPWNSVASKDILILESKTPWSTWLMTTVILASVGVLVVSLYLEKRLRGPRIKGKTRKP